MNLVSAVVCLNPGDCATEEDIKDFVRSRVRDEFQSIRGPVFFRDCIPRNSRGKVLRREVTKWAREEYETIRQM